jgi:hypothetical protein
MCLGHSIPAAQNQVWLNAAASIAERVEPKHGCDLEGRKEHACCFDTHGDHAGDHIEHAVLATTNWHSWASHCCICSIAVQWQVQASDFHSRRHQRFVWSKSKQHAARKYKHCEHHRTGACVHFRAHAHNSWGHAPCASRTGTHAGNMGIRTCFPTISDAFQWSGLPALASCLPRSQHLHLPHVPARSPSLQHLVMLLFSEATRRLYGTFTPGCRP